MRWVETSVYGPMLIRDGAYYGVRNSLIWRGPLVQHLPLRELMVAVLTYPGDR